MLGIQLILAVVLEMSRVPGKLLLSAIDLGFVEVLLHFGVIPLLLLQRDGFSVNAGVYCLSLVSDDKRDFQGSQGFLTPRRSLA